MRFGRRQSPAPPARPVITDPFAVVPLVPADVELKRDSRGHVYLRREETRHRWQQLLRQHYDRKVELDEVGSLFYGLVDGRHSLRQIADRLAEQTGRPTKEIEAGVVVLTKQLMTKHLLQLQVTA